LSRIGRQHSAIGQNDDSFCKGKPRIEIRFEKSKQLLAGNQLRLDVAPPACRENTVIDFTDNSGHDWRLRT
jgi:hypothetical protein